MCNFSTCKCTLNLAQSGFISWLQPNYIPRFMNFDLLNTKMIIEYFN